MKLPNARAATVDPKKLDGYLLSSTHPIGRPKAQFFLAVGVSETEVVILERALLEVARTGEVAETTRSADGVKNTVDGLVSTPSDAGDTSPRFVTGHPF